MHHKRNLGVPLVMGETLGRAARLGHSASYEDLVWEKQEAEIILILIGKIPCNNQMSL